MIEEIDDIFSLIIPENSEIIKILSAEENRSDSALGKSASENSEELKNLFISWKLSSEKTQFVNFGFTINDLKIIQNEEINVLFPNTELIERIRLKDNLKRWKQNCENNRGSHSSATLSMNDDVTRWITDNPGPLDPSLSRETSKDNLEKNHEWRTYHSALQK